MGTKAVRFSKEDERLIQEFLEKNPMFDFSMLTRMAISSFIKNPKVEIIPINNINIKKDEEPTIQ
jgi:hypothetical protein